MHINAETLITQPLTILHCVHRKKQPDLYTVHHVNGNWNRTGSTDTDTSGQTNPNTAVKCSIPADQDFKLAEGDYVFPGTVYAANDLNGASALKLCKAHHGITVTLLKDLRGNGGLESLSGLLRYASIVYIEGK